MSKSKVGNGPKYYIVKFTYNFVLPIFFLRDGVRKPDKNQSIHKNEARWSVLARFSDDITEENYGPIEFVKI